MNKSRSWTDKIAKDKNGRITLWQSPNLPIIVWAGAVVASKLISSGKAHQASVLIAFGAIFTWAWMECFNGVNYFRRAIGFIVLAVSIHSRLY